MWDGTDPASTVAIKAPAAETLLATDKSGVDFWNTFSDSFNSSTGNFNFTLTSQLDAALLYIPAADATISIAAPVSQKKAVAQPVINAFDGNNLTFSVNDMAGITGFEIF